MTVAGAFPNLGGGSARGERAPNHSAPWVLGCAAIMLAAAVAAGTAAFLAAHLSLRLPTESLDDFLVQTAVSAGVFAMLAGFGTGAFAAWTIRVQEAAPVQARVDPVATAQDARLASVLSGITDCYYTLDREWRMTSINPPGAIWFGEPEIDLIGVDVRDRLRLKRDLREAIGRVLAFGEAARLERHSLIQRGRWIEFHVYPSDEGASVFFRDITERRAAQAEIEQATDLLQGSLDAMDAQIALVDDAGRIVAVNAAWRDAATSCKLSTAGLGASYLQFCGQIAPDLNQAKVARALRGLLAGRRRSFGMAYVLTTPEGVRWRRLRINRFRHGRAIRLIASHEDVTEVARAQAALRETSERLLTIQDEERQRIAVELHDSTSQHLVALGLGVTRLRRGLGGSAEPVLDDMSGSIAEALKEIRVFSYLLSPPDLERDGLEITASRFVSGFGARAGLATVFRAEGELESLDPAVQRAAFRIVQEALSNVHRHADARGAEIDLTVRAGELVLRVADDGRGIDLDAAAAPLGVGILGMRARVDQLGGALTIGRDGTGTVVEARFSARPDLRPNLLGRRPLRTPALLGE